MDPSTLVTLAQTIIQVLESSFVEELGSVGRVRSEVEKLKSTMSTINAVLIDAEEQEMQLVPRRNVERDWLEKLRYVVYEADDLFDRIASVAQRKRIMSTCDTLKEVLLFFSRSNQLSFARNASREVKMIAFPKLVYLPQGIQHLVALQYLRVEECPGFKLSAKCASRLTSVKFLFIYRCDGFKSLPKAALSGLPSLEQVEIKNCELLEDWVYELSPLPPRRF